MAASHFSTATAAVGNRGWLQKNERLDMKSLTVFEPYAN